MGVVNGKKLVFFGGADGICYAFEALTEVPAEPIHFKKVWQYDCVPESYRHDLEVEKISDEDARAVQREAWAAEIAVKN